jgi:hypothetical protein
MSMGMQHWYRMSATLPGAPTDFIQIELYDKIGTFAGTTVHTGTFRSTPRVRADPPRRPHPRVPHLTRASRGKVAAAVAIWSCIADTRRCTAR